DLPAKGADPRATSANWNMDYAWFTRQEAQSTVPAHAAPGKRVAWPSALVSRLVRFHLIDSVNGLRYGQRPLFAPGDVKKAELSSTVESVEGTKVTVRLEGATRAEASKPRERFVETRLVGRATWDTA